MLGARGGLDNLDPDETATEGDGPGGGADRYRGGGGPGVCAATWVAGHTLVCNSHTVERPTATRWLRHSFGGPDGEGRRLVTPIRDGSVSLAGRRRGGLINQLTRYT